MMAWMPQLPSTTWVTPKSTPMDMSEIASSSVNPLVVIGKLRILRNASRRARSIEDFFVDLLLRLGAELLKIISEAEAVQDPFVLGFEQRVVQTRERTR